MKTRPFPSLYQVNTRVWLTELSRALGRKATLDDISDNELGRLAGMGFDWVWFLSVWRTGEAGRRISRENDAWRKDFEDTLPDLKEEDISGSGFAITAYSVHPELGGDEALERLRERMKKNGLKLMLDFVPNHVGPDHHWVDEHPGYFIQGSEEDLEKYPMNYIRIGPGNDEMIIAHGRDPYFDGWPDTLQLDYSKPETIRAMRSELIRISGQCDGVRCDMAMLVLPEVFEKTWGRAALPFWPQSIGAAKQVNPDFCLMAEVYWDMEWRLMQEGFDYAYDKRLYDRLHEGDAHAVRKHLSADTGYQERLARFLENHDEQRAATSFLGGQHEAAAIITYLSPGLRFFHQGQIEGRRKRISPHLVRAPEEDINHHIKRFYYTLIDLIKMPVLRQGTWSLLETVPAWDGNESADSFIAYSWEGHEGERLLVIVNYAPHSGQCYVYLPFMDIKSRKTILSDLLGEATYERDGNDLLLRGLYLDMPPWGYHVFKIDKLD